jgi:Gpi18-like mannosyltransferase
MSIVGAKLSKNHQAGMSPVIVTLLLVIAVVVRFLVRDFISTDYTYFTSRWYKFIQVSGDLLALRLPFSNYTTLYLYLLSIANVVLPFTYPLHAIKLISVIFDFLCAFSAYKIIETVTGSTRRAWIGGLVVLLCPTVVANSAVWGQADSIFTAFMLLSLWRLLKGDGAWALVLYGIAFAFKLQAIFLAPLYIYLMLDRRIRLVDLLVIPAVYLLVNVPALLIGRPWVDILSVYLNQTGTYSDLTYLAPNIYQWLPVTSSSILGMAGIAAAGLFVAGYYLFLRKTHRQTVDQLLPVSLTLLLSIPFFLPHMHDRYFYPADVLAVVIAFTDKRLWCLPFLVVGASSMAYLEFLANLEGMPLGVGAVLILAALIGTVWMTFHAAPPSPASSRPEPLIGPALMRKLAILTLVSVIAFVAAIPAGQVVAAQIDRSTVAAVFSLDDVHITLRVPKAIRCADGIHVEMTWTDTQGAQELRGAHLFLHALSQNQALVAQGDGPTQLYPLLVKPSSERREIPTSEGARITQVKVGLYQYEGVRRYQALTYDGTPLDDNALLIPVQDGFCPSWKWAD